MRPGRDLARPKRTVFAALLLSSSRGINRRLRGRRTVAGVLKVQVRSGNAAKRRVGHVRPQPCANTAWS